jgi:hypothetical protein
MDDALGMRSGGRVGVRRVPAADGTAGVKGTRPIYAIRPLYLSRVTPKIADNDGVQHTLRLPSHFVQELTMRGFKERFFGAVMFLEFADGLVAVSDIAALRCGNSAVEPFEAGIAVCLRLSGEWVHYKPFTAAS